MARRGEVREVEEGITAGDSIGPTRKGRADGQAGPRGPEPSRGRDDGEDGPAVGGKGPAAGGKGPTAS